MEIISHRGLWDNIILKNSALALEGSFKNNFGTETDIRDYNEELVISHDIADSFSLRLDEFLSIYKKYSNLTLALNIKSDGLALKLLEKIKIFDINNYFVFDMSIPDTLPYIDINLNFFMRQSEIESDMSLYEKSSGIWLDSFYSDWYDGGIIYNHLINNKKICIVSPELHRRDYKEVWSKLKSLDFIHTDKIILCTDMPKEAQKYFNI
jgi:hypothetical protein